MKHKEIYTDFVVFLPDYLISPQFSIRFPQTLQLARWVNYRHSVNKFGEVSMCQKLRYHLKHKEIYTDFVVFLPDYLISPQFSIRFPQTLQLARWVNYRHSVNKFGEVSMCQKLRYHLKHKEIYTDFVVFLPD